MAEFSSILDTWGAILSCAYFFTVNARQRQDALQSAGGIAHLKPTMRRDSQPTCFLHHVLLLRIRLKRGEGDGFGRLI